MNELLFLYSQSLAQLTEILFLLMIVSLNASSLSAHNEFCSALKIIFFYVAMGVGGPQIQGGCKLDVNFLPEFPTILSENLPE